MGTPAPSPVTSSSLLDLLDSDSKTAAGFPLSLYNTRPENLRLNELFDQAESRGLGGKRLLYFVALTLSLLETEGIPSPWIMVITDFLRGENLEELYGTFRIDFIKRKTLKFSEEGYSFQYKRDDLVSEFEGALPKSGRTNWAEALAGQRDADVEELFTRLFASGQRQILSKCLNGEALTKTERETFSRTIKKRLLALLDPEVQRIARVLTGPGFRKKRQDETGPGPRLVRHTE